MKVSVLNAQLQPFVNQQQNKQKLDSGIKNVAEKPINVELINSGDKRSFEHAEMLFKRANAYAGLTMQAQRMLTGYEGVVLNERKETIRQMLGVDIYA